MIQHRYLLSVRKKNQMRINKTLVLFIIISIPSFSASSELINSNCKCSAAIRDIDTLLYLTSSSSLFQSLVDKFKTENKECQKLILKGLADSFDKLKIFTGCLDISNEECEKKLNSLENIKERTIELADIAYGDNNPNRASEAGSVCISCLAKEEQTLTRGKEDIHNIINEIANSTNEAILIRQCEDIAVGEEKIVLLENNNINVKPYTITREADSSYSIPLYLKFSPSRNYDGPVDASQVQEHYIEKTKECMEKANPKLLGPHGKQLNIAIKSPPSEQEGNCKDEIISIRIQRRGARSFSDNYAADIDCPLIAHEIMHLLGLEDEYEERHSGYWVHPETKQVAPGEARKGSSYFQYLYDCRVIRSNSLMAYHFERWDNVFKHKKMLLY